MNTTTSELPESRVEIRGELSTENFEHSIEKVARELVANAEIEGFRKGKAPAKMVLERVGEDRLLHQAAEEALKLAWPKILTEQKIEAIGPAEFHIIKMARGNPLSWLARVAVMPKTTLGNWQETARKINNEKDTTQPEITSQEIDETLDYIHKSRAKNQKPDAPPAALDDAFAQSLGDFPTLEALKENISNGLRQEKMHKQAESHKIKLIDALAQSATIEIPSIMIDAERDKMAHELRMSVEDIGLKWEDYLTHIKKTETELRDSWADDARRRVRVALTLREIAKSENIVANADEIKKRVDHILAPYPEAERARIDPKRVSDYAESVVRNEKVLEFLVSIV